MREIRLYSKDKFMEDTQFYDIPPWGWLCKVSGKTSCILTDPSDIRRYRNGLQKAAWHEMAELQEFVCRNGVAYAILSNTDRMGVRKILRSANAGYGKYRYFAGKQADFAKCEPVPIRTLCERSEIIGKFFYIFHVADNHVSDV